MNHHEELTDEEINHKIDVWAESDSSIPLHQFLGITKEQYWKLVQPKSALEATKRKGYYLFSLAFLAIAVAIFCCVLVTVIYLNDTKEDTAKLCTTTIIILNAMVQVTITFISTKIKNS